MPAGAAGRIGPLSNVRARLLGVLTTAEQQLDARRPLDRRPAPPPLGLQDVAQEPGADRRGGALPAEVPLQPVELALQIGPQLERLPEPAAVLGDLAVGDPAGTVGLGEGPRHRADRALQALDILAQLADLAGRHRSHGLKHGRGHRWSAPRVKRTYPPSAS